MVVAADPSKSGDRIEHCLFEPIRPNGNFNTQVPDILASVRCAETGSTAGDFPTFLRIDLPADGATIDPGQLVNVEATATDYEAGQLTVTWVSDVSASTVTTNSDQIGTIQLRTPGIQHLTASAVGSDGIVMRQTITLNVSASSSDVVIAEPSVDGLTFAQGLEVTLAAAPSVSSGLGAALDCSAAMWSSAAVGGAVDFAGLTGCTIQPTILGSGSHQVVLTYTDPNTGVKSTAKRKIEMTTVSDFVAQIVSPAKSGAPAFLFDQTLTLGAQAINGTNVTYQWSVTVGPNTVSVPGSTPTVPFTFAAPLTEICATQTGQIDLIATNGADGTQVHDSEQFFLSPSAAFATQCTR